jgi:Zn-dependent peptidase ImmA (M78 family)/DNA-binding XRE family transcriptional regulator
MKIVKLKRTSHPEFNHKLIAIAREQRGIGQSELAIKVGIDQGNISRIERGIQNPTPETMEKIAEVLNYSISFFRQESRVLEFENSYYRRKLKIPKKDLLKAEASINVSKVNLDALLQLVELPLSNYLQFDLSKDSITPAQCAMKLRKHWQISNGYVPNLTQLLEKNGIVVINIDFGNIEIDGHAVVTENNIPIIFINKNISADRYRLTLAHELGHLVLHLGKDIPKERDVEEEAFLFAGEFMMPEREIKSELMEVTIERLMQHKQYWKISMGALLKRARVLEMISENQYKYLWQQMTHLGYKRVEPAKLDFPKEQPSILRQLIDAHLDELDYKESDLAEFLGLRFSEFEDQFLSDRLRIRRNNKK